MKSDMKVVLFNVKFSPNVGDGVIAESLERFFSVRGVEAKTFDIAGRSGIVENKRSFSLRELFIKVSSMLPRYLRRAIVVYNAKNVINKKHAEWFQEIQSADLVIVGGGNLVSDADLNFPSKITGVIDICSGLKKPVAFVGVGVSSALSKKAVSMFSSVFKYENLLGVWVRDSLSKNNFEKKFHSCASVIPDPAVSVRSFFSVNKEKVAFPPVAVNVACPANLVYSGDLLKKVSRLDILSNYQELVDRLLDNGADSVFVFTNGAFEDEEFKSDLLLRLQDDRVISCDRPKTPDDLVAIISGVRLVMSYRLHACIVAYSLGVKPIGFEWDSKIVAFFQDYVGSDNLYSDMPSCFSDLKEILDDKYEPIVAPYESEEKFYTVMDCIIERAKEAK